MVNYIVRRMGYALIMLVLVSFASFVIINLPPSDFLTQKLEQLRARGDRSAEGQIETYRRRYNLDKPFMWQYTNWAVNFLRGDFGESFEYERPVREMLGERVTMTIILGVATLIVTWALAIPLGVFSAVKQYSLGDQIITTLSFVGLGMPGFLLALLILYFAITVLNIEASGLFSQ
ncbi:MAG TPA: ABC transporter permease, partial [Anaerolineales bacterium]|nr:ABC transporter permease [Anaerolineales bacterium]